ncbi:type II toxin-antitoxin system RelE/ParE family toxin [Brevibacterium casei]|uniref:Toxin n=1 Tax=Brevibacterium casei TaxID=33889 RepID=A0A7T3ZYI7_9MICO|nr:type II toxin-antitoxin system RelE/ParE family toxin [Brevibacterium casei]QQB14038.1 type II toxin-antitoxin system RelE/ParE family toxin [Brevibacterium casei]
MNRYRLSAAAQRDLSEIWDYTERRWDSNQAENYMQQIRSAVEHIAADPGRGRAVNEIREGYRRFATGSHVLFYRVRPKGVDVIRVLHQRMDPTRHL